jgi:hypothetical protein
MPAIFEFGGLAVLLSGTWYLVGSCHYSWEATFCGETRHQTVVVVWGDLAEGAKLLFGLAFRSGYTGTFQAA